MLSRPLSLVSCISPLDSSPHQLSSSSLRRVPFSSHVMTMTTTISSSSSLSFTTPLPRPDYCQCSSPITAARQHQICSLTPFPLVPFRRSRPRIIFSLQSSTQIEIDLRGAADVVAPSPQLSPLPHLPATPCPSQRWKL
ncbi:hypothetical protein GALMADRAFT_592390 [Galerina marginata CBS 339.88]|uniref:Uncharacterized protein n=1 Tax=Galerina marginata (strain CBS 339.88) TaxID=685588 RepID=A0A067T1M5_GALM3|nr:hypothetical protein GALMADRAFT_592390 [Galerina marginata CBS 339.88]